MLFGNMLRLCFALLIIACIYRSYWIYMVWSCVYVHQNCCNGSEIYRWNRALFLYLTTQNVHTMCMILNTLRPRQNGRHFADDILKYIFLNKNVWISIEISLKFVPKGPINNIPALVQIMAWRRPGDKTLSEQMMVRLPTMRHSASMS